MIVTEIIIDFIMILPEGSRSTVIYATANKGPTVCNRSNNCAVLPTMLPKCPFPTQIERMRYVRIERAMRITQYVFEHFVKHYRFVFSPAHQLYAQSTLTNLYRRFSSTPLLGATRCSNSRICNLVMPLQSKYAELVIPRISFSEYIFAALRRGGDRVAIVSIICFRCKRKPLPRIPEYSRRQISLSLGRE